MMTRLQKRRLTKWCQKNILWQKKMHRLARKLTTDMVIGHTLNLLKGEVPKGAVH